MYDGGEKIFSRLDKELGKNRLGGTFVAIFSIYKIDKAPFKVNIARRLVDVIYIFLLSNRIRDNDNVM